MLDRIEIAGIGRQMQQHDSSSSHDRVESLTVASAKIFDDEHLARLWGWAQKVVRTFDKAFGVDRAVEETGGLTPVAQGRALRSVSSACRPPI